MNGQEPLEGASPPTSNSVRGCSARLSFGLKFPINTKKGLSVQPCKSSFNNQRKKNKLWVWGVGSWEGMDRT